MCSYSMLNCSSPGGVTHVSRQTVLLLCYLLQNQVGSPGAVIKAACLGIADREFDPRSGIQVLKKQNVSPLFTCEETISWKTSVTER